MEEQKKYYAAGVLLIVKIKDGKKYIILVKRTENAPTNPGTYSGFFGWTDANSEEINRPDLAAQREVLEEVFIFSDKEKTVYNLVFIEDAVYDNEKTVKLIRLWNKKIENFGLPENSIVTVRPSIVKEVEFPEHNGITKIFILECDFSQLDFNNLRFFDGEQNDKLPENDEKSLLDRRIYFFEFGRFKSWWQRDKEESLCADISFRSGEKVNNDFIDNKKKISPSLVPCLNEWQKSW